MTSLEPVGALIADLWRRMERPPGWMPDPLQWYWRRPGGAFQGIAPIYMADPGLTNLLWLSMDLERPPEVYEATENPLYMMICSEAVTAKVDGQPLIALAALLPMAEFCERLAKRKSAPVTRLEQAYPLLEFLLRRRLGHAHP